MFPHSFWIPSVTDIWITICGNLASPTMGCPLSKSPTLPLQTALPKGDITHLQAQWQATTKVARGRSTWHQERLRESGLFSIKKRRLNGDLALYSYLRGSYGEDRARLVAGTPEQGRRQWTEAGTQETPVERKASLFYHRGDQTLEHVVRDVVETWSLKILRTWLDKSTSSLPTCIILCSWYLSTSTAAAGEPFQADVSVPLPVLVLFNLMMMNTFVIFLFPAVLEAKQLIASWGQVIKPLFFQGTMSPLCVMESVADLEAAMDTHSGCRGCGWQAR